MPLLTILEQFQVRSLPLRRLLAINFREHVTIYVLASLSNAFLTASQYLAVSAAVVSYLPVDPGTSALITRYGPSSGIVLALVLNSLIFQGVLAVLLVASALSAVVKSSWRWAYACLGVIVSGFVGYWLAAKFLVILEWISTLQNSQVNSSNEYTSLFWFGLAASTSYVLMILVLRKSYEKLARHTRRVEDLKTKNSSCLPGRSPENPWS